MELLSGCIYSVNNKINGTKYIGQTTKTLAQRLNVHFSKYSRCSRLKSAIKHHGKENFEIIEIERFYASTREELSLKMNSREKELIVELNTLHPFGYNLTNGGDRSTMSQDVIDRMAKGHLKPVKCLETGKTWESVKACAEFFNIKPKQVSRVLKGQRKRLKRAYTLVYLQQS